MSQFKVHVGGQIGREGFLKKDWKGKIKVCITCNGE